MLVKQFALLLVGYAYPLYSSATTLSSHISSSPSPIHTSQSTSKSHTKTVTSSLIPIATAKTHTHHHSSGTGTSLFPLPSANSTILSTGSIPLITPTHPSSGVCPTYTTTLAAKRCPMINCGPEPMAQVGGGGVLPEKRCVMESTTTVPCGCPTPMATTTVLGGCDAACPPKGCQIAWVTKTPTC